MSRRPDVHVSTPRLLPEETKEVVAELELVLASPLFRGSRRCQSLLRRITECEIDSLKERSLGVEVFGRPADYDTSQDPVVRSTAAEIRKKLAQYYVEAGRESEMRIELPPGSYHAEFHFGTKLKAGLKAAPQPLPEPALIPAPDPIAPRRPRITQVAGFAIVAVLIASLVISALNWRRPNLDDLWGPVLKTPETVLVCMGLQAAYNLRSAQAQDAIQGVPGAISKPQPIHDEDLILLRDRYVALDDALCLVRIISLLERYRKAYRIRADRSTSFADLRDTPAVLIGAFDNPWTLRTAGQLRFTFSKDGEHDIGMVHDRLHPENSAWRLANYWPNWDVPVDYAIVTRMVDTTTDRPVIIAAGLTQYGTIGAGEFLTNAVYFAEAADSLPRNWEKKNLQIVLSVPVVNRISGRPRILATHVW